MLQILKYILIVVVVTATTAWMRSLVRHRRLAKGSRGATLVRPGLPYKITSAFCLLLSCLMVWITTANHKDPTQATAGALLVLFFGAGGLWLFLEILLLEIRVTADGIVARSPWRRQRLAVPWKDVERVSFSTRKRSFIIHIRNGATIHAHDWLDNIDALAIAIVNNLPEDRWVDAAAYIVEVIGDEG